VSDYVYRADQETPSFAVAWKDRDGDLVDFSSGYTFTAQLVKAGVVALTKTAGIAGNSTSPNVTVAWTTDELDGLSGVYEVHLKATTGGADRFFRPGNWPTITIEAAPS